MGDRSTLQCFVHAAAIGDHPAILEVLAEHRLGFDYEFPEFAPDQLALGVQYVDHESPLGTADELAADLQRVAPSALFEVWQDPYEQVDGWYIAHIPGFAPYEAACNPYGTALVSSRALGEKLRALPAGTTVEHWLARHGEELLGTRVLTALTGFPRRTV